MYKIKINREKCKGCGICVDVCPENWKIWDDNKAHVIRFKVKNIGRNKKAAEECPFGAITIEELS